MRDTPALKAWEERRPYTPPSHWCQQCSLPLFEQRAKCFAGRLTLLCNREQRSFTWSAEEKLVDFTVSIKILCARFNGPCHQSE